MRRWPWAALGAGLLLMPWGQGCGEGTVTRLRASVRPRKDDFKAHIQPMLELGCTTGCHETLVGELLVVPDPGGEALQQTYLYAVAHLNLEAPAESKLICAVNRERPDCPHAPKCLGPSSCQYQRYLRWIAWQEEGDPRPGDADGACAPRAGDTAPVWTTEPTGCVR